MNCAISYLVPKIQFCDSLFTFDDQAIGDFLEMAKI